LEFFSKDVFGEENTGRPSKICVILRGLPGSGKSFLAQRIRNLEKERGKLARILSIGICIHTMEWAIVHLLSPKLHLFVL